MDSILTDFKWLGAKGFKKICPMGTPAELLHAEKGGSAAQCLLEWSTEARREEEAESKGMRQNGDGKWKSLQQNGSGGGEMCEKTESTTSSITLLGM